MSDYQYTYPDDLSYLNKLPERQRQLAVHVLNTAKQDGADLADVLRDADAPDEDKTAVAAAFQEVRP